MFGILGAIADIIFMFFRAVFTFIVYVLFSIFHTRGGS